MRDVLALGISAALLLTGCDGKSRTPVDPARNGSSPSFDAAGQGATVTVVSERYSTEDESFTLCDGSVARGDITWHEVILNLTNANGTMNQDHLNTIDHGTALGPDGTVYLVRQVNDFMVSDGIGQSTYRSMVRIMLLSPGNTDNVFATLKNGVWTTECHG